MRNKERFIDRLRQKGWYWDLLQWIYISILFIGFMVICIKSDAQKNNNYYIYKPHHNLSGYVGLASLPAAMVTVTIRDAQWKSQYGIREPYMQGEKLETYNMLMQSNKNILIGGAISSVGFLLLQGYINRKINKKQSKNYYPCHRHY
jgi:hypothetical protein